MVLGDDINSFMPVLSEIMKMRGYTETFPQQTLSSLLCPSRNLIQYDYI